MCFWLRFQKMNQLIGIGSLLILTGCAQVPQNNNEIMPILKLAAQQNQHIKFSLPNKSTDLNPIKFLSERVISLGVSKLKGNDILLETGTGTIIGAANEATLQGKDASYYVMTNIHVANDFYQSMSAANSVINGFWFAPNRLFDLVNRENQTLTNQELTDVNDDLVSHFNLRTNQIGQRLITWNQAQTAYQYTTNLFSIPLIYSALSQANTSYWPMDVNQSTKWFASQIKINKPLIGQKFANSEMDNYPIKIKNAQAINALFAADLAIMKVNFSFSNQLATSLENKKINNFLAKVNESIQTYGDLNLWQENKVNGYLLGMPASWKKDNNLVNHLYTTQISVALKMNLNQSDLLSIPIYDGSYDSLTQAQKSLLTINKSPSDEKQLYWTPTTDYIVNSLNLGHGSSGSLLINYDANNSDVKKQFSMAGIYWGVFSETTNGDNLQTSRGGISKFVVPGTYDLIGGKNHPVNTPKENNFCSYITEHKAENNHSDSNHQLHIPDFC